MLGIGDWVEHIHYHWHGPMKITAVNFGTATLLTNTSSELYYMLLHLKLSKQPDDLTPYYKNMDSLGMSYNNSSEKEVNPLFCSCSKSEAEIVQSSIQIQGAVNESDKFKFCRTCKKEAK